MKQLLMLLTEKVRPQRYCSSLLDTESHNQNPVVVLGIYAVLGLNRLIHQLL